MCTMKEDVIYSGFTCQVSAMLPYPETVKACDIETKEEVNILTGEEINCMQIGDKLIMTQEVYDSIKNHEGLLY